MTQEYEFFKDFAGVTKADLEIFKCGGKKKKMEKGGKTKTKIVLKVEPRWGGHAGSDTTYTRVRETPTGSRELQKESHTVQKIPVINKTIKDEKTSGYDKLQQQFKKNKKK